MTTDEVSRILEAARQRERAGWSERRILWWAAWQGIRRGCADAYADMMQDRLWWTCAALSIWMIAAARIARVVL